MWSRQRSLFTFLVLISSLDRRSHSTEIILASSPCRQALGVTCSPKVGGGSSPLACGGDAGGGSSHPGGSAQKDISKTQTALRTREDHFSSPQVQGRRKEKLLLPAETTRRPCGGCSARWHQEGLIQPLSGLVLSHSSCCCSLCIPSAPEQLLPLAGCPMLEQDVSDLVCREGTDAR